MNAEHPDNYFNLSDSDEDHAGTHEHPEESEVHFDEFSRFSLSPYEEMFQVQQSEFFTHTLKMNEKISELEAKFAIEKRLLLKKQEQSFEKRERYLQQLLQTSHNYSKQLHAKYGGQIQSLYETIDKQQKLIKQQRDNIDQLQRLCNSSNVKYIQSLEMIQHLTNVSEKYDEAYEKWNQEKNHKEE
jgi:hypothetical protein